ncbi:MAG: MBL fold metallo-hydrolase, partial [Tannerella sp.]|nr:MBL fold metallo-hydrolase [Tannerella sp.]
MFVICATAQEPQTVITFQAGNYKFSVLSEGGRQGNSNLLKGATDEQLKKYLPDGTFPLGTHAFLVQTPDNNILIDAGYGKLLFQNLKSLKLDETKIHIILLTHMHGDHIGGLLKDGKTAFPNAKLYLSKKEHDYWMNLGERGATQQNVLNAYKSVLHLLEPYDIDNQGEGIKRCAGIIPIAAYGHTPGHTAYYLKDANWLIWGDLTHAMPIQMPCPEVALSFDVDAAKAIESRKKILKHIVQNGVTVSGMHIPFPAVGKIKEATEG